MFNEFKIDHYTGELTENIFEQKMVFLVTVQ